MKNPEIMDTNGVVESLSIMFHKDNCSVIAIQYATEDSATGAELVAKLNMREMSRQLRFGKSVSDNSFGRLREMLSYKLYFRGKKLLVIDKWYASSQLCHICSYKNGEVKDLSIRSWKCPSCGTEHDRDINAAINLREEGKRLAATTVGHTGSNACGECVRLCSPTSVMKQSSKKQEAPAS